MTDKACCKNCIAVLLNKTRIHNSQRLENLIENRPKDHPLLTISNHHSCFDDPGIFGCLKLRNVASSKKIRWSLAAYDICFTNRLHSTFFMFGKCIPCIRGGGVYQPAVDLCIQKLKLGEWVRKSRKKQLIDFVLYIASNMKILLGSRFS